MFNSNQLQNLAKAKAQAVTDQRNSQGTVEVQPQMNGVLKDPNEAYIAVCNVGYSPGEASKIVMQGPEAVGSALGFGHGGGGGVDGRGNAQPFGSENDVNSRRDNPYGVTSVQTSRGGFSGNPEHFQTTGNPNNMPGTQVGYGYNSQNNGGERTNTDVAPNPEVPNTIYNEMELPPSYGHSNASNMFNALAGINNLVRGNDGQQSNHNGGATNASNMFNTLAGVNNLVRGNNGTQPTYQPVPGSATMDRDQPPQNTGHLYSSEPQVYPGQQYLPNNQPGPQWAPVQNSAAAGPPGHGGSNPGFTGMMSNTGDTMAALKALAERMRNRS